MSRLIALRALAAALAVAFLMPAVASAEVGSCPPGFTLIVAPNEGSVFWADRNGDSFQCLKLIFTPPFRIHFVDIDNNVRSETASGLTEDGSTVLVDTDTGGVLSP